MTTHPLNVTAEDLSCLSPIQENCNKLKAYRHHKLENFKQIGLPTNRTEKWRFTPLFEFQSKNFKVNPLTTIEDINIDQLRSRIGAEDDLLILQCNGNILFADEGNGLRCQSILEWHNADYATFLSRDIDASYPMAFLNGAFLTNGLELSISENLEKRVHIVHLAPSSPEEMAIVTHNLIAIDENCTAEIVEHFISTNQESCYFHNHLTHIDVADHANLKHYRHQDESLEAFHYSLTIANIGEYSNYKSFTLTTGAKLARNEILTNLNKSHSHCQLDGSYLIRGNQHSDTSSVINHIVPDCTSHQVYKGTLDDHARGVFQGRINVHRDAQRTDGYQLNRALLLSDHAEINSKPELEIFADDVKCSHGATAGELEDNALFYLMSRGIPEQEARSLLIASFANEAIDYVESEPTADYFRNKVLNWLGKE